MDSPNKVSLVRRKHNHRLMFFKCVREILGNCGRVPGKVAVAIFQAVQVRGALCW